MPQVLYRKWRPRKFAELYGQEHVASTLVNALTSNRVAHAYLFTGTRGTGKTTAGRLLARALNCTDLRHGEPCNRCATCKVHLSGRSLDLIEIDAASNRGIDDVRALRDRIGFAAQGKRKVYLIDEAHMLTDAAFNALLKVLEEPPEHIVFVLATTEVHKIPATILSRCQRFDFKRASTDDLVTNLARIVVAEEMHMDPNVLGLIAEAATGSHRDAVSLLDQLTTTYGKTLEADVVKVSLGFIGGDHVPKMVAALRGRDLAAGLQVISGVRDGGHDLRQYQRELVTELRRMTIRQPQSVRLRTALRLFAEADLKNNTTYPLDIALTLSLEDDVAKRSREKPLKTVDEGAGIPITKERTEKAAELLGRMTARFDEDFIMHVATEIGLDECVFHESEESEQLSYDLTALQLVSLGSALAACAEFRDGRAEARKKKRENEQRYGKSR